MAGAQNFNELFERIQPKLTDGEWWRISRHRSDQGYHFYKARRGKVPPEPWEAYATERRGSVETGRAVRRMLIDGDVVWVGRGDGGYQIRAVRPKFS